jgi:hypothetical protein
MRYKHTSTTDSFSMDQLDWNGIRAHYVDRRLPDFYQYGPTNTATEFSFEVPARGPRLLTLQELSGPPITDETAAADWDKFLEIVANHGVPDSDFTPLELRD